MAIIIGIAVLSTAVLALVWACACIAVLYWIATKEEVDLERVFGCYLRYKKAVPMFLPRFRKTEALERD